MQRVIRFIACCGLVGVFAVLLPLVASAHEHRNVANNKYVMIVGFLDEPAFAGLKNGLDLRVQTAPPSANQTGQPVTGLDKTLKAEAIFGDQKLALTLTPRFQVPGAYDGVFFPMKPGDYTFHITGTIDGSPVDETFTSSPNTFSSVEDPTPLELPKEKSSSVGGMVLGTIDFGGGTGGIAGGLAVLAGVAGLWSLRRREANRRRVAAVTQS